MRAIAKCSRRPVWLVARAFCRGGCLFIFVARTFLIIGCTFFTVGCAMLEKKEVGDPDMMAITKTPLKPEQAQELVGDVGHDWLYGQGLGNTAAQVGAIAIFPPFGLVVLGNAALEYKGYKPIGVSTALPEEGAEAWSNAYDSVVSVPGKVAASAAGEDFRTPKESAVRLNEKIKAMQAENEREKKVNKRARREDTSTRAQPRLVLPKQVVPEDY